MSLWREETSRLEAQQAGWGEDYTKWRANELNELDTGGCVQCVPLHGVDAHGSKQSEA